MNSKVLVYAELAEGKVESSAYELFTKAMKLFPNADVKKAFVVLGSGIDDAVKELTASGADEVYAMDDPKLAVYNVDYYAAGVSAAIDAMDPDIVLFPASALVEELAPTCGLKYKTGVSAHCVDLVVAEDGQFVSMVPAFGGKVIGEIMVPGHPQMSSIKPGNFTAETFPAKDAKVVKLDAGKLAFESKITAVKVEEVKPEGMPVDKAPIVVSGGFGIGNQENWDRVEKVAALMGGTYGCSRPVVDAGWVKDEKHMVGTSGKTTRPKVYIANAISGATHHLCGMKDSGVIISLNASADADIFAASNYKYVGDGNKVIEEMLKILEK